MRFKQIAIMFIGVILIVGSLPLSPFAKNSDEDDDETGEYAAKDEAIYGNLKGNGTLEDMYVVNTFHVDEAGEMTDHGDYSDVRNLTNLSDIEQDNGDIHFQTEKDDDDFNYQGFLENESLPWDIDITYKLDGEEVNPEQLAGKDGSLEIQIETSANDDAEETFFEHYMLQISLTLDPSSFDDIQAPDGTKAKEGKDTNVTFTGMPEEKGEFIVSAEVTDLEMDPIEISASPASMPIDDPDLGDMKGDMSSLSDAITEINDGVGDMKSGISELDDGASDLSEGSASYSEGIHELDQSSGELVDGSAEINNAFQQVDDALQDAPDEAPDVSELEKLPDVVYDLSGGLDEAADGVDTLRDDYETAYNELNETMDDISEDDLSEEEIDELFDSDVEREVIEELVDSYKAAQEAKDIYEKEKEVFDTVTGTLDDISASITDMSEDANTFADEMESGLDQVDDLDELGELQTGLSELTSQYESFHQGLVDYTDGVGELASNYGDIDDGINGLADGTDSLEDGASDLQDGTEELEDETSDMPGEMQSEVDEMMEDYDDSDFEPISFVSDENEDIDVVQFALKTESIEIDEPDDDDDSDNDEEEGFWDRLLGLFK